MLKPNLNNPMRMLYAVFGLACMAAPFVAAFEGWLRIALPILGLVALAEGLTGW